MVSTWRVREITFRLTGASHSMMLRCSLVRIWSPCGDLVASSIMSIYGRGGKGQTNWVVSNDLYRFRILDVLEEIAKNVVSMQFGANTLLIIWSTSTSNIRHVLSILQHSMSTWYFALLYEREDWPTRSEIFAIRTELHMRYCCCM